MTDKEELMKEVVMKDNMILALKSEVESLKLQLSERHGRHGEEDR